MVDAYADREQAGESLPANDRRPNHQAKRNAVTAVGFVCKRRFGEIVVTTYNKACGLVVPDDSGSTGWTKNVCHYQIIKKLC